MESVQTIAEVRSALRPWRGSRIGLVPTMGALHAGHEALLEQARRECDLVVASIFVNPAQFGDPGDLERYPRPLADDLARAAGCGVDLIFAPGETELYPPDFATWVEPAGAALGLEGVQRPGHFRGVATVCVKLFAIVAPDVAYFGRKDAQQVAVIKQVVRDLNLDLEIRVVDTVRDGDGVALSSRNQLLSAEQRLQAAAIPRALETREPARARALLIDAGLEPDYVEVADLDGPTLALATRVGPVRLIDNIRLGGESR